MGYNILEVESHKKSADVWIEETTRSYELNVQELVETGGYRRYEMSHGDIENTMAKVMIALEHAKPDTILAVSAILFTLVCWKFSIRIHSALQFAQNFLTSGEKKPICYMLRQWLYEDFETTIKRYEYVKLTQAVNATRVLEGDRAYELRKNGELSKKFY